MVELVQIAQEDDPWALFVFVSQRSLSKTDDSVATLTTIPGLVSIVRVGLASLLLQSMSEGSHISTRIASLGFTAEV